MILINLSNSFIDQFNTETQHCDGSDPLYLLDGTVSKRQFVKNEMFFVGFKQSIFVIFYSVQHYLSVGVKDGDETESVCSRHAQYLTNHYQSMRDYG